MKRQRSGRGRGAFPGALILMLVSGACQDVPSGPRAPVTRAASEPAVWTAVYSGASSDSLLDAASVVWDRLGHDEERRSIDEWREREVGTVRVRDLASASDWRATPPSMLLTGGNGTVKPPPMIVSHREAVHFGGTGGGITIPDIVEAEMTFKGDQGKIAIGSLSIVSKSGFSYAVSGELASGVGQLISCLDVMTTTCSTTKRLAGSLTASLAPVCDATASGTIQYAAQNVQGDFFGLFGANAGNITAQATMAAYTSATASPCAKADTTDSTSTTQPPPPSGAPTHDPSDGDPIPPNEPYPDPEPLPPPPPPPPQDDCTAYIDPTTLYIEVTC